MITVQRRSVSAVALLIALVLPAYLLTVPESCAAEAEMKLYLQPSSLQTQAPTASVDDYVGMRVGVTLEYELQYPLVSDLEIIGTGGNLGLRLEVGVIVVTPGYTGIVLLVEVIDSQNETIGETIASKEIKQASLTSEDFELPMLENTITIEAGHYLTLRLTLTEGSGPPNAAAFRFYYTLPPEGYSYISFKAEPVRSDGVAVNAMMNGAVVTEVLPNAPEDARTLTLSASAADAFGANDVSSININITGPDGGVLLDATGQNGDDGWDNSDGEAMAFYNMSYTIPENLPEGDYTMTATAASHTGQTASGSSTLTVASGLFFALTDAAKKVVTAGDIVEFEAKVINGGSGDDRVSFSALSDRGYSVQPPSDLELSGGSEGTVKFRVSVPVEAQVKDTDTIRMKASSRNAGKDYEVEGEIEVGKAATFAITSDGDTSRAVFLGDGTGYTLDIRNLENVTRTYELSIEDAADGIEFTFYGQGVTQGSVYSSITVGPRSTVEFFLNVTAGQGTAEGSLELKVYGRIKGETERKYVYLTMLVVDGDKDVITPRGGTVERTAARAGNDYPVGYKAVAFTLDVYNPTLREATISIDASGPAGWTISGNYEGIDLLPGTSSTYNVSITPAKGEAYTPDDGKVVKVTASGSGVEDTSVDLEVRIPLVLDIRTGTDLTGPLNGKAGSAVTTNITIRNQGNRAEKVNLSAESKEGLTIALDPPVVDLAPGEEGRIGLTVDLPADEKDANFAITVKTTAGGKTATTTVDIFAKGVKEGADATTWIVIGAMALLVVLGIAGAYAYFRMSKKERPAPAIAPQAKKEFRMAARPAPRPYVPPRPIAPPPDEEAIRRADALTNDLLETRKVVEVKEMD